MASKLKFCIKCSFHTIALCKQTLEPSDGICPRLFAYVLSTKNIFGKLTQILNAPVVTIVRQREWVNFGLAISLEEQLLPPPIRSIVENTLYDE